MRRRALDADDARVGPEPAGGQGEQRGLPGAVRADEARDLPSAQLERGLGDRDHRWSAERPAKRAPHPTGLQRNRHSRRPPSRATCQAARLSPTPIHTTACAVAAPSR
jgi:hypothetical protein